MDAILTLPAVAARGVCCDPGEPFAADQQAWRVLLHDGANAQDQMVIDEALAVGAQPTLRLFRWARPAFSLGRNQLRPEWLTEAGLRGAGVEVVERPTGGGLALHGGDLSCSVVVPQTPALRVSSLMTWICRTLAQAFGEAGHAVEWVGDLPPAPAGALGGPGAASRIVYCLAQSSSYALMAGGKKFGGFALRRYPRSLLVQGSCALRPFPEPLMRAMSLEALDRYAAHSTWLEAAAAAPVDEGALIRSVVRVWESA